MSAAIALVPSMAFIRGRPSTHPRSGFWGTHFKISCKHGYTRPRAPSLAGLSLVATQYCWWLFSSGGDICVSWDGQCTLLQISTDGDTVRPLRIQHPPIKSLRPRPTWLLRATPGPVDTRT